MAENVGLILEGAERGRMSITEFRGQYLIRLGEEALSSVTAEMCSNFISRIESFLPGVLREEDVDF